MDSYANAFTKTVLVCIYILGLWSLYVIHVENQSTLHTLLDFKNTHDAL